MISIPRPRFTLASISMFVVASAAGSALFVKVHEHTQNKVRPYWAFDIPTEVILSIGLTAIALGALKRHTSVQTMLQATVAYLGYISLFSLAEGHYERALIYWFQTTFALTVAFPLVARRLVKSRLPRGPRRTWWKNTYEALVFSFLNIVLVAAGALVQYILFEIGGQLL